MICVRQRGSQRTACGEADFVFALVHAVQSEVCGVNFRLAEDFLAYGVFDPDGDWHLVLVKVLVEGVEAARDRSLKGHLLKNALGLEHHVKLVG